MAMIERNLGLVNPLGQAYPFYVLIETSGSDAQHDEEVGWHEHCLNVFFCRFFVWLTANAQCNKFTTLMAVCHPYSYTATASAP